MSDLLSNLDPVRPLNEREFEMIRRLARDSFGLDLRKGKEQMIGARLNKVIRGLQLKSFEEYHDYVKKDRSGQALTAMIDALTTNFTSFFRETAHFDLLRGKVFPELKTKPHVRIWSAGCSTGEEPYSLAICAAENLPAGKVEIVATDISTKVLETCDAGLYAAERVETVSQALLQRYFLRGKDRWAGWYRVKPALRQMVRFERLNLLESFSSMGSFDVIACRNVMIYFDRNLQQQLVQRFAAQLERGGYLLIGHSETLNGMNHGLQYVAPAVYRKAANR